MKITTDTPQLLIVENRPVVLGAVLIVFILVFLWAGMAMIGSGDWIGLVFIAFGAGSGFLAFWALVRRVQVVFDRATGTVEIRRRGLFSASRVRHKLTEIDRAVVEESRGTDSTTFRVALVIGTGQSAGHHPLTKSYSNSGAHARIAQRINAWLADQAGG